MALAAAVAALCVATGADASERELQRRIERLEYEVRELKAQIQRLQATIERLAAADAVTRSAAPPTARAPVRRSRASSRSSSRRMLTARLLSRRFEQKILTGNLWLDIEFTAAGLTKTATMIEGVLRFYDATGRMRVEIDASIDRRVSRNDRFTERGVGVEIREHWKNDQWLVGTDIDKIVVMYEPKSIRYADGTSDAFTVGKP
jgi:hypothetical protein